MLFDARFFELPERQRAESLATFDWVEFRCDLKQSLPIPTIAAAGFVQVDVNLHFRIDLSHGREDAFLRGPRDESGE